MYLYIKHAFLQYLKQFRTVGKRWKQERFWYNILTCRDNFESNEAKWCILTPFETYARRLLGDSTVLPTLFIFIENFNVLFFSFFQMKCRPGPTGPIGATPVGVFNIIFRKNNNNRARWLTVFISLLYVNVNKKNSIENKNNLL